MEPRHNEGPRDRQNLFAIQRSFVLSRFFSIYSVITGVTKIVCTQDFSLFYYIDTSVLLENILLVKFIETTSGTRVAYFP